MPKDRPTKKDSPAPRVKPSAKSDGKAAPAAAAPAAPPAPKKPAVSQFRKEFEPYRQVLVAKRRSLLGDMAAMRDEVMGQNQQDASGDLSKMPIDMADVGSDNYEREFTISLVEKDQGILAEIEDALQRMEAGTYFACSNTDCGKDIPRARLDAKPFARFCIECQKKHEKGLI